MLRGSLLLLQWLGLMLFRRPVTDETSPQASSARRRYRRKKHIVKGLWFASGLMMLAFPITHFIVTLGLFTTFLSFTILDESA